jgi:hypothetical protein
VADPRWRPSSFHPERHGPGRRHRPDHSRSRRRPSHPERRYGFGVFQSRRGPFLSHPFRAIPENRSDPTGLRSSPPGRNRGRSSAAVPVLPSRSGSARIVAFRRIVPDRGGGHPSIGQRDSVGIPFSWRDRPLSFWRLASVFQGGRRPDRPGDNFRSRFVERRGPDRRRLLDHP